MKRSTAAFLVILAWAAGLAALGLLVERRLDVSSDLRLFLPAPATPEQRLLLDAIGEGPASRLLVVTIEGAPAEALAATSSALVALLRGDERFRFVANGDVGLDLLPDDLLPYRYLLSADDATRALDRTSLRSALQARARDLSSPAGFAVEPLIARDPTLLTLTLAERWQPAHEPRREFDVWFDAPGERALLVAETRAPAFDPAGQRAALAALDAAFAAADAPAGTTLTASGAGSFSVLMEARTRSAAESLARWATVGMLLVLLVAYRRRRRPDLERLAARQRSRRRPRSGQRAIRLRARHHARVRLHAARRGAGLSAASLEPPPPRRRARARRGRPVAHARHGHRQHVRRVSDVLVQRRHGTAATCVFHRDRARGGRFDRALCAAARHDAGTARLRPVARARAARASHRYAAAADVGGGRARRRVRRRDNAGAATVLGERLERADAGARGFARARSRAARRAWRRRHAPSARRRSGDGRRSARSPRGARSRARAGGRRRRHRDL